MFDKCKNVSELIQYHATKRPDNVAITAPRKKLFGGFKYKSITFLEANKKIDQFVLKLQALGVKPQDRVLIFVKPNLDFNLIVFALFRLGAIAIFIDPGMKREYFFKCIKEVKPDALIGISKVHLLRLFYQDIFSTIKIFITMSHLSVLNKSLYHGLKKQLGKVNIYQPKTTELAAILYTSGGTGKPKGVEYGHDIFINQTRMLKTEFSLNSFDIDIPGFPLFSLFTMAIGMNSAIPFMDAAKPAECKPEFLYQNIQDNQATFIAGSTAIWERLADYCLKNKLKIQSVKSVVMFGAPVTLSLHRKFAQILTQGTTYTPYGATECLPVTNVSGKFILSNAAQEIQNGKGVCVGPALEGVKVKIIKQSQDIIKKMSDVEELGAEEIGEIIVNSLNVTKAYFEQEEATQKAKIYDGQKVWHRMGDVGYLDKNGNLWFCGRLKHVVELKNTKLYPIQVENIFNQHPKIKRSALIKNEKEQTAALVIERNDKKEEIESMFLMDLKNIAQGHEHTKFVTEFYARKNFPVDTRHNIKIDRTRLQKDVMENK